MFSPDTILFVDEGYVHEEVEHREHIGKKYGGRPVITKLIISADGYCMELEGKVNKFAKGNGVGRLLEYQACLEEIRKARAGKDTKAKYIIPPKDERENDGKNPTSR